MSELLLSSVREFVKRYVEPVAVKVDREDWYPRELVRKMGEMGFLAPMAEGLNLLETSLILKEVSKSSGSVALIQDAQGELVTEPLRVYGDEKEIVEKLSKGELIGGFALSEPQGGSDVASIRTRAERQNGRWVIKGKKMWTTQGLYADVFIVAAKTGDKGLKSITTFLVERGPCTKVDKIEVMGNRGTGTAEVEFNGCEAKSVIGGVDGGWEVVKYALLVGRVAISAIAIGLAEGAVEEAISWAQERELFGSKLADKQGIQWYIADAVAKLSSLNTMLKSFVKAEDVFKDEGRIAVLKYVSTKVATEVVDRAVQIMGGLGYAKGSKSERAYRDVRLTRIGEGTDEVQLGIIYKVLRREGLQYFTDNMSI
ncbi:acyl-CoA dehydrogenase family protein [Stygiolobus caldivivus]|uniref:Acyl-CoA dehydrogenase n=1 Tax=Stygiolobus caldivivus TaxID=2824673 RepID=A0A8D5U617_9CREN|nr:acyl-CoA dehydrogenase family protein [Stygiolobus caldivivus]BCU69652.1 acyl-CoA dehydrogenase [Stygiolobus caldivivus]